jgi:hypothetical protein
MKANEVKHLIPFIVISFIPFLVISLITLTTYIFSHLLSIYSVLFTEEPSYNDIGLYDTSSIACDILCYQLIRYVLRSLQQRSFVTTQNIQSLKLRCNQVRYTDTFRPCRHLQVRQVPL